MEEENLSLSAEELSRIDSYQNELDAYEAEVMASVEAPEAATAASEPSQPTQTSQPTQQQSQPATEPSERAQAVETSPFKNPDGTIDYEKITRYGAEQDTAEAVGLYDFAVDSINKLSNWITGNDTPLPQVPEFENKNAQFMREASAVILPGLALGGLTKAGGTALAGSSRLATASPRLAAVLNDPAVKAIGGGLASMGSQVAVTGISRQSEKDDNLPGVLRSYFPRTFSWIPDNIATLDSDSPDTKRLKNINFDVGLGFATDLVPGIAKFLNAQESMFSATRFVPENEVAEKFFKDVNLEDPAATLDELVEDTVNKSALQRSIALDELGEYNLSKTTREVEVPITGEEYFVGRSVDMAESGRFASPEEATEFYRARYAELDDVTKAEVDELAAQNPRIERIQEELTEPVFGVHDMYGYRESGVRGVDDLGIVGAQLDNARIFTNEGSTYGRVGNAISDGALKYALDDASGEAVFSITKGLGEQLQMSGRYGYETAPGRYLTGQQIEDASMALVDRIYGRPIAEVDEFLQQYRSLDVGTKISYLTAEADAAVLKSIGKYMDVYANLDEAKASALIVDSMAGQISDMSFSARMMDGTDAIARAEEMILDRVEYLVAQDGMTRYLAGRNLRMTNLWTNFTRSATEKQARKYYEDIMKASDLGAASDDTFAALAEIKSKAKGTRETIEALKANNPDFMKSVRLAWELTDGDVSSISKMNTYFQNLGGFRNKAFLNTNGIESLTKQAIDGIVYNNMLSAVATPIRAVESTINAASVPLNVAIGGIARGDLGPLRKAGFMYSRWGEILKNSTNYAKQVFRRSGMTAEELPLFDSSVKLANQKQLEFMEATGEAYAKRGEFGPMAVYEQVKMLTDFANHPWLSLLPRGLQTLDGFNTSILAQFESYGRAFDEVTDYGRRAVDYDSYTKIGEANYSKYFDADSDLITDAGIKAAAGEINYNKNSQLSNFFGDLTRTIPAIKPYLMFTRTPIQELSFMMKYEPFGAYARKLGNYSLPFDSPKLSKDQVLQALREDGIKAESADAIRSAYTYQRDLALGRKATGAIATSMAVWAFLNGNITGDGLADRQKQAGRRDLELPKRSVKTPLGWFSYDNLGPVSDWVAMTVTFMENFDSLDGSDRQQWLGMAMHSLSATITEKTMLPALEPLLAAVNGDASQLKRFAGSYMASATVLGSGQIAEWGRLFDPMRQDMEATFTDQVLSRNPLGRQILPNKVDYIDGPGEEINPLVGLWNTYTPWKVNGALSEPKQYLLDVEYDGRAVLKTFNGIKLTPTERNQIATIIGEEGYYRDQIMQIAEQYPADEYRSSVREFNQLPGNIPADKVTLVHNKLDTALKNSIRMAVMQLDNANEIFSRATEKKVIEGYAQRNEPENARQFIQQTMQNNGI